MNILRLSTLSLTLAIAMMTLGYVSVASAAKPICPGDHPSCKEAGESGYSVTIEGHVEGASADMEGASADNWLGGVAGKNSIGLNDASEGHNVGAFTGLEFFTGNDSPFGSDGASCFPSAPFTIHQAIISRGKGGRAQASFWFDGFTKHDNTSVLYALALFGQFDSDKAWPPVEGEHHLIMMTDWKIIVENEGKEIKSISCIGEGEPDDITVAIEVTKVTKE